MRKSLVVVLLALLITALLAGCYASDSDDQEQAAVENQQAVYTRNQPPPVFDWSLERDIAIQLYEARNEARLTYSVVVSQGTGAVLWMCPSIGYPIPYDVQLTNPVKPDIAYGEAVVLEQSEPNGLYSSKNTDATWVICVDDTGNWTPVYVEQKVITFPFPVVIQDGVIVPADNANPSVILEDRTD